VKSLLRKLGVYERLKASWLYDVYWTIFDSSHVRQRRAEEAFYRSLLGDLRQCDVVFDIGANIGAKTLAFVGLGATVVAIEPDEENQQVLDRMFLKNRFRPKPVLIVGSAVGAQEGEMTMFIDHAGSAKNTLSSKWVEVLRKDDRRFGSRLDFREQRTVAVTTLEALIRRFGKPVFVKIDVEGYELDVLQGLEQPVPLLSFEVNLPEFRHEGLLCAQRLAQLSKQGLFNYVVDCKKGLELAEWLPYEFFQAVLQQCTDRSIDVLWRSAA
jgi:FkbM family methyltransferase